MTEVVAGIDIGGTNSICGIVDKAGKVITESNIQTAEHPDINSFECYFP